MNQLLATIIVLSSLNAVSSAAPRGREGGEATPRAGVAVRKTSQPQPGQQPAPQNQNVPQPQSGGCQFRGQTACADCLLFWSAQGDERNNHFCKDKSRANGTKGWDCFNFAEDTSHGYQCIAYCPPDTPTCETNCNQRNPDGSPNHRHPLRAARNRHTGRVLGPPGSAPVPHQGKESRDKCVW